jgi:hypothetical protein
MVSFRQLYSSTASCPHTDRPTIIIKIAGSVQILVCIGTSHMQWDTHIYIWTLWVSKLGRGVTHYSTHFIDPYQHTQQL